MSSFSLFEYFAVLLGGSSILVTVVYFLLAQCTSFDDPGKLKSKSKLKEMPSLEKQSLATLTGKQKAKQKPSLERHPQKQAKAVRKANSLTKVEKLTSKSQLKVGKRSSQIESKVGLISKAAISSGKQAKNISPYPSQAKSSVGSSLTKLKLKQEKQSVRGKGQQDEQLKVAGKRSTIGPSISSLKAGKSVIAKNKKRKAHPPRRAPSTFDQYEEAKSSSGLKILAKKSSTIGDEAEFKTELFDVEPSP